MDKAEAVADDDQGQLVRKLRLLEEVLDFLWVVEVALAADALDFADLPSARRCLNVLEVNFGILTQVDDRTEVVVQALDQKVRQIGPNSKPCC